MKKYLLTLLVGFLAIFSYAATSIPITITTTELKKGSNSTSYVTTPFTFTVGNYTFKANQINPDNGQLRVNQVGDGGAQFSNTTPIKGLSKITLTSQGPSIGTWYMKVGNQEITTSATTSDIKGEGSTTSITFTVPEGTSAEYFRINVTTKGSGTVKLEKLVIEYNPEEPVDPDAPTVPIFSVNGSNIDGDSYTFTSLAGGNLSVEFDEDATGSMVAYEPDTETVIEDAISGLETIDGLWTFNVVKPCTIVFTAERNDKTSSKTVTFDFPAPDAAVFWDKNYDEISGTYNFTPDEEGASCTLYALAYDFDLTDPYTLSYTVNPESALVSAEDDDMGMLTFVVNASCEITVTTANSVGKTTDATLKVNFRQPGQKYEKVKNGDVIAVGDQVVIISATTPPASVSATPNTVNGELKGVTSGFEISSDGNELTVDDPDKVAIFTVVKGKTNYALQYQTGEFLTLAENGTTAFNSTSTQTDAIADVKISQGTQYITISFTGAGGGRNIREFNGNFRAYAPSTSNGNSIYLYRLAAPAKEVTLAWDKAEYTYDMDFGWEDGEPSLTSNPEIADDIITYSSSNTDVATISNSATSRGTITPKAAGKTEISAVVNPDNKYYTSNTATYTLNVVGATAPQFVNEDDVAYPTDEIKLLPSVLSDGYTFKIKGTEGYGLKVTFNPPAQTTGTVTPTLDGAMVTVYKECKITARNTKTVQGENGPEEKVSTRSISFNVSTVELAPADIKWTADRYVYDLATKTWNNTPELINTNNLPLIYSSSDESVVTISQTGKITPVAQGTATISAKAEGTDTYNTNTVTATIRVTDSEAPVGYDVFEMVKKGDQLRENEQFIIVSGEPFNPEAGVHSYTKEGGQYYALTPYRQIDSQVRDYYQAVPVEFPDGDESGERLLVADDAQVLRLSKQYDTSGADPANPFLFQVMNEDIDLNNDDEICDTDNPTTTSGNNERINGRYIQVKRAKLFSFVDLPENFEDRGMMNGNIRILDPEQLEGYTEEDYIDIKCTSLTNNSKNYSGTKGVFTDKGEILFKNSTDGKQYFVRFNPTGIVPHFNVYELDTSYNSETRSKQGTFPFRIYRLANRVEKPSITVYPEEPVASDIAYEEGVVYNNKVRVVIEQHPKTSPEAKLMRQWQKEGRNPALPDYESFNQDQVIVYVDGHVVVDEEDNVLRYIDPDFNTATAQRTLFAVSNLDDVYSESAEATFNFKTSAPRITKVDTDAEGNLNVRVSRGSNYTKDAVYYYMNSDGDSKPEVTFNQDGTVNTANGELVEVWTGDAEDTTTGIVQLPAGQVMWVGAFKAGYQPTWVQYTNNTVFPECRPMQLLRLTDEGRDLLLNDKDFDKGSIFGGNYDPSKPLYINYRNDLVNEDGTVEESDHHFHYMIQRDHAYNESSDRRVWIEQISEAQFQSIFGTNYINVDPEHAKNYQWTSDFYVFALNEAEFTANFTEKILFDSPQVITPDRTYTTLHNTFVRKPTNSDGTYKTGEKAEEVSYYGAMVENDGKLGAKTLTTTVEYMVDDKIYDTEATAEIAPRIPAMTGFNFEYQYEREPEPSFKDVNPDADFAKIKVPSAIEGRDATEALIPIEDLNCRHLNMVFKFNRPNISKHILQNYDIYYTLKFYRVNESDGTEQLMEGSGVYVDNELEEGEDAVYRFRIDDVNPMAVIYPKIEISKVTYVGNSDNESYGQYTSNFGKQKTLETAPNNSAKQPLEIGELKLRKTTTQEIDGKQYADWQYVSHTDFADTPDIIINNGENSEKMSIQSAYYHIEVYVPGTDYYSSYEYLVKHDDDSHNAPDDPSHPFFNDGYDQYDALRNTIIARNVPLKDGSGYTVKPTVVIAPVYFFGAGPEMKPVSIDEDDNIIASFEYAGGHAHIIKVNDIKEATPATPAQAPRRVESANGTAAPSTKEYPMPHAGDTDMNHASIVNLTDNNAYTVVKGGNYESQDLVVTGIEDVYAPGAADGTPRYYNLQGIQVANPDHGIYIRVVNGQSEKVVL